MKYLRLFLIVQIFIPLAFLNAQDGHETIYTSVSDTYALKYPSLWLIVEEDEIGVTFADSFTTRFLLENDFALETGQVVVRVFDPLVVRAAMGDTMDTVIDTIEGQLFPDVDTTIEKITIGRRDARRLTSKVRDTMAVYAFTMDDGQVVAGLVLFGDGERVQAESRVFPVFASMTTASLIDLLTTSDPQSLEETIESVENGIAFDIPERWAVDTATFAPAIVLSSQQSEVLPYAAEGRMGGMLTATRAAWISPELSDSSPLGDILQAEIANDDDFLSPRTQIFDNEGIETAIAFENVITFGEITLLLMRLKNDAIVKFRFATADEEAQRFTSTALAILRSIRITDETALADAGDHEQLSVEANSMITTNSIHQITLLDTFELSGGFLSDAVYGIDVSPDDTLLAASYLEEVLLLDAQTGQINSTLSHIATVYDVDFHPDGKQLLVGIGDPFREHTDNRIVIWNLETEVSIQIHGKQYSQPGEFVRYNTDGSLFGGRIAFSPSVYNAKNGRAVVEFTDGEIMAFSPDMTQYAATYTRLDVSEIRTYDAETAQILRKMPMPDEQNANEIEYSPDGSLLVIGYSGFGQGKNEAQFWNPQTGEYLYSTFFTNRFAAASSRNDFATIEFSPDGTLLVTGDANGMVCFWDASSGEPINRVEAHQLAINDLAFTSQGTRLYVSSRDGTISVWSIQ